MGVSEAGQWGQLLGLVSPDQSLWADEPQWGGGPLPLAAFPVLRSFRALWPSFVNSK